MSYYVKREFMPGVTLCCVQTDQFKSGYFSVTLLRRLEADSASKTAVIPRVLRRGCREYPDLKSLSARLDFLYGSSIWPTLRQRGELLCPGFAASFVEDRFLPTKEKNMESVISLTARLLLDPLTRHGLLNADYVNSEKSVLLNDIRSVVDDKRGYAVRRLREIMFAGEDYAAFALGSEETASRLHYVSLTKAYQAMLAESEMIFFYCGQAAPAEVSLVLREAFADLPRGEIRPAAGTEVRVEAPQLRQVTEEMDVTQANLVMGFRLGEIMYLPDYAAIRLFNGVFGGDSGSKLFQSLREERGLCYYASSSIDTFKGVMAVSTGIEPQNYNAVLDEIGRQLEACRRGEISEKEMETVRRRLIASLRSVSDSPDEMDDFFLSQELHELRPDPDEMLGLLQTTTTEDLVRVAESIRPDTVFFLKPEERGQAHEADGI